MVAKRHHYVPRCYLKHFSVVRKKGKHQVFVFDREARKSFQAAIENVAVEKDFNRIDIEGIEPDAFEKGMAQLEAEAAPAIERTVSAGAFANDDDRAYILNLIGLLALRNPRWRENMRDFQERVARQIMGLAAANKERWEGQVARAKKDGYLKDAPDVPYEEMKRFLDEGKFKIEVAREHHIQMEMHGFEAILPHLFKRNWVFLKASADSGGFVTSDHPVRLIWSNPKMRGGFYGPGYGLRGTEVIFPLSHRMLLVGAFEIEEGSHDVPDEFVAGLNGHMIGAALRQVYARDMNFRYQLLPTDEPRKASKLISDLRFTRSKRDQATRAEGDAGDPAGDPAALVAKDDREVVEE